MLKGFLHGDPIQTDALTAAVPTQPIEGFPFAYTFENGCFRFWFELAPEDIVFGLGESPRGINKRGWIYESYCTDDPFHTETKRSLYAAHNFIVVSGKKSFGLFIDFPARIRWDLGYTSADKAEITVEGEDFAVYLIDGEQPREIIRKRRDGGRRDPRL